MISYFDCYTDACLGVFPVFRINAYVKMCCRGVVLMFPKEINYLNLTESRSLHERSQNLLLGGYGVSGGYEAFVGEGGGLACIWRKFNTTFRPCEM